MATARNNWKKQLAYLQLNNSVPKLIYILYIFGGLGNIGKQFETLLKGNRELLRAPTLSPHPMSQFREHNLHKKGHVHQECKEG